MAKTRKQLEKGIAVGIGNLKLLTEMEFKAYQTVFDMNDDLRKIYVVASKGTPVEKDMVMDNCVDTCMSMYQVVFSGFININCNEALTNKDGKHFDETLLKACMFFTCAMDMLKILKHLNSISNNYNNEIIACSKKLYDLTVGFEEIIKKAKAEGLQLSEDLQKDCYEKKLDCIFNMVRLHSKLNQSEKALTFIDEGLNCINYIDNNDQHKGLVRRFFYAFAIINFFKINDLESTVIYLDKYLSIAPNLWKEENTNFHAYFPLIVKKLLKENNLDKAREYCEIMAKSNITNLVKFAKEKIKDIDKKISALAKQEDKTKGTKKDNDKTAVKIEADKSNIIVSKNINAIIIEPKSDPIVAKFDAKQEIDECDGDNNNNAPQRKEKLKTRGVPALGKEEVAEASPVISDARKYGFSDKFADEKIYPLHSNFVPDGVYYVIYPKKNREYELTKGEHETNERAVEDGIVGAGRSRIRYVSKNKFKVGRKKANSRFFTEVVEQRDGKILLSFSIYHDHKTQSAEYDKNNSNQNTVTTNRKGG